MGIAWSPLEVFFLALALRQMARSAGMATAEEPFWRAGLRWALSDLLLSARLGPVLLLGILPGAFVAAWAEPQDRGIGLLCFALLLAGLIPAMLWLYFRSLSPCLAVLESKSPAESLDLAPARLAGRHARACWLMGVWGSASLLLGHAPDLADGWLNLGLSALCLPAASLLLLGWMLELYREQ